MIRWRPGSSRVSHDQAETLRGEALLVVELHATRLELISELVPRAKVIGLLVNPSSPQTEQVTKTMREASRARAIALHISTASAESEIETAFVSLARHQVGALVV